MTEGSGSEPLPPANDFQRSMDNEPLEPRKSFETYGDGRSGVRVVTDNVSKDLLEAKLEAVEARTQTQFAELKSEIANVARALSGENGIASQLRELKADNKNTRVTVWVTVAAGVISLMLACLFFSLPPT